MFSRAIGLNSAKFHQLGAITTKTNIPLPTDLYPASPLEIPLEDLRLNPVNIGSSRVFDVALDVSSDMTSAMVPFVTPLKSGESYGLKPLDSDLSPKDESNATRNIVSNHNYIELATFFKNPDTNRYFPEYVEFTKPVQYTGQYPGQYPGQYDPAEQSPLFNNDISSSEAVDEDSSDDKHSDDDYSDDVGEYDLSNEDYNPTIEPDETHGIAMVDLSDRQSSKEQSSESANNPDSKHPTINETAFLLNEKGVDLMNLGKYEEALISFNEVLRIKPEFGTAEFNRAIALSEIKQYKEAIDGFDRSIDAYLDRAAFYFNKWKYLISGGNKSDGAIAFDYITDSYARIVESYLAKGQAFLSLGQTTESLKVYDEIITVWNNLSTAFYSDPNFFNDLTSYLQPYLSMIFYSKGNNLASLFEFDNAIISYNKAIQLNPSDPNSYYEKANALMAKGKNQEALDSCNEAILLDPHFAQAHNSKGIALNALHEYKAALDAYNEAIRWNPFYADAYNNKANNASHMDHMEEAVKLYNKAISIDPKCPVAYKGKGAALYKIAKDAKATKSLIASTPLFIESIDAFSKAIDLDPLDSKTHFNKGNSLRELNEHQEAIASYDASIALNPHNPKPHYYKGRSLAKLSQNQDAVSCYDQAMRLGLVNKTIETYKERAIKAEARSKHSCEDIQGIGREIGDLNSPKELRSAKILDIEALEAETLETNTLEAKVMEIETPEIEVPKTETPEIEAPETEDEIIKTHNLELASAEVTQPEALIQYLVSDYVEEFCLNSPDEPFALLQLQEDIKYCDQNPEQISTPHNSEANHARSNILAPTPGHTPGHTPSHTPSNTPASTPGHTPGHTPSHTTGRRPTPFFKLILSPTDPHPLLDGLELGEMVKDNFTSHYAKEAPTKVDLDAMTEDTEVDLGSILDKAELDLGIITHKSKVDLDRIAAKEDLHLDHLDDLTYKIEIDSNLTTNNTKIDSDETINHPKAYLGTNSITQQTISQGGESHGTLPQCAISHNALTEELKPQNTIIIEGSTQQSALQESKFHELSIREISAQQHISQQLTTQQHITQESRIHIKSGKLTLSNQNTERGELVSNMMHRITHDAHQMNIPSHSHDPDLIAIYQENFKREFYVSVIQNLTGAYLASTVVHSGIVANNKRSASGAVGNILSHTGFLVPGFGGALTLCGALMTQIDNLYQCKMLENFAKLVVVPSDMTIFAATISKNFAANLTPEKLDEILSRQTSILKILESSFMSFSAISKDDFNPADNKPKLVKKAIEAANIVSNIIISEIFKGDQGAIKSNYEANYISHLVDKTELLLSTKYEIWSKRMEVLYDLCAASIPQIGSPHMGIPQLSLAQIGIPPIAMHQISATQISTHQIQGLTASLTSALTSNLKSVAMDSSEDQEKYVPEKSGPEKSGPEKSGLESTGLESVRLESVRLEKHDPIRSESEKSGPEKHAPEKYQLDTKVDVINLADPKFIESNTLDSYSYSEENNYSEHNAQTAPLLGCADQILLDG